MELGLIAILISVVAAGFAGYQAWIGARQTRIQRAAAELSFNLDVTTRLGDVLLAIADRPDAHVSHLGTGLLEQTRCKTIALGTSSRSH